MKSNLSLVLIVVFILPACSGLVEAMTIEEALANLRSYRFGEADETLNTIREAAIRSHGNPAMQQKLVRGLAEILDSDAAYDAKQFACRQLALIGDKEQVPALANLLADEQMSHMALYALVHIPGEEVDQALVQALDKAAGRARGGIITALGERRASAAVEKLAGLLKSADTNVASESAGALGRIATTEAAKALEEALSGKNAADPMAVADAYLACADSMLGGGDIDSATAIYRKVYTSCDSSAIRSAALVGLTRALGHGAVSLLVEAIGGEDFGLRATAAQLAREIPGHQVTEALAGSLPKLPLRSQKLLLIALAFRGDEAASPAVEKACNSADAEVRIAALEALGKLGNAGSVGLLIDRAASAHGAEQTAARTSLRILRGQDVNRTMVVQLKQASDKPKVEVINALAERDATETVPAILAAAKSSAAEVRAASLRALSELAGREDIPALVDLLVSADTKDTDQARKTLVSVSRRCSAEQVASKNILARQSSVRQEQRRAIGLQALGDLGDDSALPTLRTALSDNDENIRYSAITALSNWPNVQPMADLLRVARTSDNRVHRVLALRGYINLVAAADQLARPTSGGLAPDEKLRCCKTAMDLADNDAEKKKILAVVSNIRTADALSFAVSHLSSPTVRQEAAQAAVTIAKDIYQQNQQGVAGAMRQVVAAQVADNFRQEAKKILDEIEAVRSYLTDWEVAGPYMQEGKSCTQLFDIPFGPELPDAQVQWRPMPVKRLEQHPAYLDLLDALNGGEQRVAYLRTQIASAEEGSARLEVFSDDGVKVWLNGQLVHANNVMRPIMAEPDTVQVKLEKGPNYLLLKITQNNQPWGAIVRLRAAQP